MSEATPPVETGAQRLLRMQALLVTGMTWLFYAWEGLLAAQSALYGGGMVMVNVWMMDRRVRLAAQTANIAPGSEIRILYIAALQRFILTLGFFILGMGWFGFLPIPLLISFAVAQIAYLINGILNAAVTPLRK